MSCANGHFSIFSQFYHLPLYKVDVQIFCVGSYRMLTGNDIHCSSNYRLNRSINYSSSFYCCSFATKLGLMEKSMLYNFQISKLHSFNHFQSLLKCETSYFLKFNASTQSHQAYLIKTAVIQRQIDKTNRL